MTGPVIGADQGPEIALAWHKAGRGAVLATVIQTWGSAPRPVGAYLVIAGNGAIEGSVSGGCVEGAVIVEALEALEVGAHRILEYGVADADAFAVGLACGGTIRILLEPVGTALPEALLTELVNARAARQAVVYHRDGAEVSLHPPGRDDVAGEVEGRIVLPHLPGRSAIIIGAVHITQALVPMLQAMGHQCTVIDPRPVFADAARFGDVTLIDDWPEDAMAALPIDAMTAVITLTHDPKLDDPAVIAALRSEAYYIGCLGSTRTHAKRVARLGEAGLEAEVTRLHAPVGLNLGARSPSEIAVSIAAEILSTYRTPK